MSKKVDTKVLLHRLNVVSAALFIIVAGLAAWLMSRASFPLTMPSLTKDVLASQKSAAIVPASRLFFDISIKWLVVVAMALSAILPALNMTRWQKSYQKVVKNKVSFWRWVDGAVVSALWLGVVLMLYGVHDLIAVKSACFLTIIAFVLMWLTERHSLQAKKPNWTLYFLAVACAALPVLLLAASGLTTYVSGMIRASWHVYAAFGLYVVALVLTALNLYKQLKGQKQWKSYVVAERNYLVVNLVSRLALGLVLIVGLSK